jgi:hypothetical protein
LKIQDRRHDESHFHNIHEPQNVSVFMSPLIDLRRCQQTLARIN